MGFSPGDAEDLAQDVFVTFLETVDRFEGRSEVGTWLFGILHHKAQERRRAHAREDLTDVVDEVFDGRFNTAVHSAHLDGDASTIGPRARETVTNRRVFLRAALGSGAYAIGTIRAFAETQGDRMPRVIVCDVNETLLDVGALEPLFKQAFGDGRVLQEWFATVLLYSEVATLAGPYSNFASIGGASLDMVAGARGIRLSPADRSGNLQQMLTLPAHPDVRDGLQTMRDAGLRLVTLTNSAPAAVQQQLANAGLAPLFERSFSVDAVRRLKPAAEAYRSVADSLGLPTNGLRLVAAHAWDVVGALRAGCAAAFIARPGKVLYPLGPKPDIVGPDFKTVAQQMLPPSPRDRRAEPAAVGPCESSWHGRRAGAITASATPRSRGTRSSLESRRSQPRAV